MENPLKTASPFHHLQLQGGGTVQLCSSGKAVGVFARRLYLQWLPSCVSVKKKIISEVLSTLIPVT